MQHAHIARRVLEVGKWLALGRSLPVPVSLHPRGGARGVPAVTGRYVPVTVGGVTYQIYSESAGSGRTCYACTPPEPTVGNFMG
jgi:hypothetical protein